MTTTTAPTLTTDVLLKDGREATVTVTRGARGHVLTVVTATEPVMVTRTDWMGDVEAKQMDRLMDPGTVNTVLDLLDEARQAWGR